VNRIYFGSGYYGIESAARGYFGKPAADLTSGESATLAGLIRSPKRFAPSRDVAAAEAERDTVLERMLELEMISADEVIAAKAQQLKIAHDRTMRVTDDPVMDAVLREAATLLAPETLDYGGLTIFTTIDPQLQRLAQSAADRRLTEIEDQKGYPHPKKRDFVPGTNADGTEKPTNYLQTAVVLVDNRSGAIRALVGSRDYEQSKYCRALLARRQIGSTFKPFVYAAAFEQGLYPGSLVDDSKISPGEFRDLPKKWSPENSDGEYGGPQPAAIGLLKSRNTMSVRVGEFAGLRKVRALAQAAGVSDDIPDLPAVFLGGFETTVRDLASAYTIFPNLGVYRPSFLISSIEDREGRVLWQAPRGEERVLSADCAWLVSGILQHVMKSGTAARSASLGWKKIGAGKTGTTNDFFDAWFVGYTSSLTCAVWVGMDQPETILEKGYGSTLALPVWVEIMQQAPEKEYPAAPLDPPSQLVKLTLCSISGSRATSSCAARGCAYETSLPAARLPRETCQTHPEPAPQTVAVAPVTQPTPPPGQPPASAPTIPSVAPTPAPTTSAPAPIAATPPPVVTAGPPPVVTRSPNERMDMELTPTELRISPSSRRARPTPVEELPEIGNRRGNGRRLIGSDRVEVRRPVPANPQASPTPRSEEKGTVVRRFVERTPDGGVRTTTVRTLDSQEDDD
ncbi:MAG TPA: penicillin-binding transpeptidase domain-containing protein, partial [Chthoniobacteraceae bacterium]|nr:penicillin-binding transpeptidase domain-containing protein [Chthoniobacteraceae bacterium]